MKYVIHNQIYTYGVVVSQKMTLVSCEHKAKKEMQRFCDEHMTHRLNKIINNNEIRLIHDAFGYTEYYISYTQVSENYKIHPFYENHANTI